ncbi:MAG: RNA polymerase sigma factor [Lachnospiraceae bacterium]|nr:RNA polymerase sigma factor [Lachnospiraceae bacterium]
MSLDVEEQYDKIYRYCYFKLHNQQTAEDITQETFLRYFQRYDHVTGREALKCLYTIARNLCIDEYRRRSGERKLEYAYGGFIRNDLRKENGVQDDLIRKHSVGSNSIRADCIQENCMSGGSQEDQIIISLTVRAALAELNQDEQELLLLRYVNEVPVSAIGQMLGISRFAVHRRLAAVQKKFKDILEREGFR